MLFRSHVHFCTCTQLFDLRDRYLFQGSDADHFHLFAGGNVGDPNFMESEFFSGECPVHLQAESNLLHCEWIPQRDVREDLVLGGFLFYHVFLDLYRSNLRNRGTDLQEAEGTFCRCIIKYRRNYSEGESNYESGLRICNCCRSS